MQMTVDEFTARFPDCRRLIPAEYVGQWIAWNDDRSEILRTAMTWSQSAGRRSSAAATARFSKESLALLSWAGHEIRLRRRHFIGLRRRRHRLPCVGRTVRLRSENPRTQSRGLFEGPIPNP